MIAWIGGIGIFGTMASAGSSGSSPPTTGHEGQTSEQVEDIKVFKEAFVDPAADKRRPVRVTYLSPASLTFFLVIVCAVLLTPVAVVMTPRKID